MTNKSLLTGQSIYLRYFEENEHGGVQLIAGGPDNE